MKLPPGYVPGLLTQHKATAKGGFGEKLLRQFGWTEGKGLGAKEDGMAEALKVKQKKDQTGVGAQGSEMWRDKWWEEAYAQSVANISAAHEELNASSSDSDSSDSDYSTAEVPAAGRRVHADGTTSSATAAEQKLAAQLAKDPWGRFGGRQGKLARIRAQEEAALQARLAAEGPKAVSAAAKLPQAAAAPAAAAQKVKRRKRDTTAAAVEPLAADIADAQPPAKRKKGTKAADLSAERAAAELRAFVPTPTTGWWGAKRFVSAGAMGSTGEALKPAVDVANNFTEDTQEGLYMALHNAKSSGKTGLGKGKGSGAFFKPYSILRRPLPEHGIIGGAKWEGKKTVIVEEEDESGEGASAETTYEASPAEEAPSLPPAAKSFKFAKIVRRALRQADGQQLTLKELGKQVRQHWAASAQHGAPPAAAAFKSLLLAKLERIDSVTLQGKRVMLAA